MSNRFLFMADAHVKQRTWANSMKLSGDAYEALRLIGERVDAMPDADRPDTLVIGGDWFDSNRPSSSDVVESFAFMRRFRHVLFIRGNHDSVQPSYLQADASASGGQVTELGVDGFYTPSIESAFHGISWRASAGEVSAELSRVADRLTSDTGPRSFVVMHSSFRHLLGFDGSYQMDADELDPRLLAGNVTLLVGDIHRRDTRALSDTCSLHSPGSMYPLSWDRVMDPCSVSVVDAATGGIEALPCQVRDYASMNFTSMRDLNQVVESMAADVGRSFRLPPFIRVNVSGTTGFDVHALEEGAVVQVVDASEPSVDVPAPVCVQDECALEDAVREECSADPDLADMAVELMRADDPLAMVAGWLDFWKVERLT